MIMNDLTSLLGNDQKKLMKEQDWLSPVYLGRLEYICWNSFYSPRCIDALFGFKIPFRSLVQIPEVNSDPSLPVQSPVMFTRSQNARGNWYPRPIFILWLRSLKTPETPDLSITFGTLSACRSFETKDYWTFSHCFYRIAFCSRVNNVHVLGMRLTAVTAKASCSRQKQIHSRQKQINSECDIFIVEVSLFSKCCYSSQ